MAGDLTKRMDPYFPFEKSVEMWGRSFSKLGISYKSATMDLDLLDRKGKYSNGTCEPTFLSSPLLPSLLGRALKLFRKCCLHLLELTSPTRGVPNLFRSVWDFTVIGQQHWKCFS